MLVEFKASTTRSLYVQVEQIIAIDHEGAEDYDYTNIHLRSGHTFTVYETAHDVLNKLGSDWKPV